MIFDAKRIPGLETITKGLRKSIALSAALIGTVTPMGLPGGVDPATLKNSVLIGPGQTAVTRTLVPIVSPQSASGPRLIG